MKDARKEKYSIFKFKGPLRVIALITLWSFLFTNIFGEYLLERAWAAGTPLEVTRVASDKSRLPGLSIKPLISESFTIPEYLGHVKDSWTFPRPGRGNRNRPFRDRVAERLVIHIQDAHCNYYAQRKIAEIIEYLNKEYGIDTVNLEGGKDKYDLSIFTDIKDKATRERVSDHFVKEGLLNGSEHFAINNPNKVKLWGAEDTKLYLENLKIYRSSLKHKDEIDKSLKNLNQALSGLKLKIFPPELLELDRKYGQYKENNIEFKDYLNFLITKAEEKAIDIRALPNIYLLSETLKGEEGIDFKLANIERNALIDKLGQILSKREMEELAQKTIEFKTEKIAQKEFYEYLIRKSKSVKLDLNAFPNLIKFIAYVGTYQSCDNLKAMKELDELENKIKETLYTNDKQRELNTLSKNFALMKNLFNFTLTREDYNYYKKNKKSFDMIPELDAYREEAERFYECSFKRDEVFVNSVIARRPEGPTKQSQNVATVLVTGGFHAERLAELFKKNNISYITIMPNFKNENGYECPYFAILAGTKNVRIREALPSVLNNVLGVPSQLTELYDAVEGAGFAATAPAVTITGYISPEKSDYVSVSVWRAKDDFGRDWYVKWPLSGRETIVYRLAELEGANVPASSITKAGNIGVEDNDAERFLWSFADNPESMMLITRDIDDIKNLSEVASDESSGLDEILVLLAWLNGRDFAPYHNVEKYVIEQKERFFIYDMEGFALNKDPNLPYIFNASFFCRGWDALDPDRFEQAIERIEALDPKKVLDIARSLGYREDEEEVRNIINYIKVRNKNIRYILIESLRRVIVDRDNIRYLPFEGDSEAFREKINSIIDKISKKPQFPHKGPSGTFALAGPVAFWVGHLIAEISPAVGFVLMGLGIVATFGFAYFVCRSLMAFVGTKIDKIFIGPILSEIAPRDDAKDVTRAFLALTTALRGVGVKEYHTIRYILSKIAARDNTKDIAEHMRRIISQVKSRKKAILKMEKKLRTAKENGKFERSIGQTMDGTFFVAGYVNGHYIILTNTHVVEDEATVELFTGNEERPIGRAKVVVCHSNIEHPELGGGDIAILSIGYNDVELDPLPDVYELDGKQRKLIPLPLGEFEDGENAFLVSSFNRTISGGLLMRIGDIAVLLGGSVTYGDSGSPFLIEREGELRVAAIVATIGPIGMLLSEKMKADILSAIRRGPKTPFYADKENTGALDAVRQFLSSPDSLHYGETVGPSESRGEGLDKVSGKGSDMPAPVVPAPGPLVDTDGGRNLDQFQIEKLRNFIIGQGNRTPADGPLAETIRQVSDISYFLEEKVNSFLEEKGCVRIKPRATYDVVPITIDVLTTLGLPDFGAVILEVNQKPVLIFTTSSYGANLAVSCAIIEYVTGLDHAQVVKLSNEFCSSEGFHIFLDVPGIPLKIRFNSATQVYINVLYRTENLPLESRKTLLHSIIKMMEYIHEKIEKGMPLSTDEELYYLFTPNEAILGALGWFLETSYDSDLELKESERLYLTRIFLWELEKFMRVEEFQNIRGSIDFVFYLLLRWFSKADSSSDPRQKKVLTDFSTFLLQYVIERSKTDAASYPEIEFSVIDELDQRLLALGTEFSKNPTGSLAEQEKVRRILRSLSVYLNEQRTVKPSAARAAGRITGRSRIPIWPIPIVIEMTEFLMQRHLTKYYNKLADAIMPRSSSEKQMWDAPLQRLGHYLQLFPSADVFCLKTVPHFDDPGDYGLSRYLKFDLAWLDTVAQHSGSKDWAIMLDLYIEPLANWMERGHWGEMRQELELSKELAQYFASDSPKTVKQYLMITRKTEDMPPRARMTLLFFEEIRLLQRKHKARVWPIIKSDFFEKAGKKIIFGPYYGAPSGRGKTPVFMKHDVEEIYEPHFMGMTMADSSRELPYAAHLVAGKRYWGQGDLRTSGIPVRSNRRLQRIVFSEHGFTSKDDLLFVTAIGSDDGRIEEIVPEEAPEEVWSPAGSPLAGCPVLFVDPRTGDVKELDNAQHNKLHEALRSLIKDFNMQPSDNFDDNGVRRLTPEETEWLTGTVNLELPTGHGPPIAAYIIKDEDLIAALSDNPEIAQGLLTHAGTWRRDPVKEEHANLFIPQSVYLALRSFGRDSPELAFWRDHEVGGHLTAREMPIDKELTDSQKALAKKVWAASKATDTLIARLLRETKTRPILKLANKLAKIAKTHPQPIISALITRLTQQTKERAVSNIGNALAKIAWAYPQEVVQALTIELSRQTEARPVGNLAYALETVAEELTHEKTLSDGITWPPGMQAIVLLPLLLFRRPAPADYSATIPVLISQLSRQSKRWPVTQLTDALTTIMGGIPYCLVARQPEEVIKAVYRFLRSSGSIGLAILEHIARIERSLAVSNTDFLSYSGIRTAVDVKLASRLIHDLTHLNQLEDENTKMELGIIYQRANRREGVSIPPEEREKRFSRQYLMAVVKEVIADELEFSDLPAVGAKVHGRSPFSLARLPRGFPYGIQAASQSFFIKNLCLILPPVKSSNNLIQVINGLFDLGVLERDQIDRCEWTLEGRIYDDIKYIILPIIELRESSLLLPVNLFALPTGGQDIYLLAFSHGGGKLEKPDEETEDVYNRTDFLLGLNSRTYEGQLFQLLGYLYFRKREIFNRFRNELIKGFSDIVISTQLYQQAKDNLINQFGEGAEEVALIDRAFQEELQLPELLSSPWANEPSSGPTIADTIYGPRYEHTSSDYYACYTIFEMAKEFPQLKERLTDVISSALSKALREINVKRDYVKLEGDKLDEDDQEGPTNVTCGTICESGHQELLDPQFETYYEQLARDAVAKGMKSLDRNLKEEPLTELEIIDALLITSQIGDATKTRLEKIIEYIHHEAGIPGNINILLAIPPEGRKLWWIKDPETGIPLYAGGHFNKAGTRIHISLPLILSQPNPQEAAYDVAIHDWEHIKPNGLGHVEDDGMKMMRAASEKETPHVPESEQAAQGAAYLTAKSFIININRRTFVKILAAFSGVLALAIGIRSIFSPEEKEKTSPTLRKYLESIDELSTDARAFNKDVYTASSDTKLERYFAAANNRGGTMLGVSSQLNFSIALHGNPSTYVIIDNNPVVTEIMVPFFGAIIERSETRREFLSYLLGIELSEEEIDSLLMPAEKQGLSLKEAVWDALEKVLDKKSPRARISWYRNKLKTIVDGEIIPNLKRQYTGEEKKIIYSVLELFVHPAKLFENVGLGPPLFISFLTEHASFSGAHKEGKEKRTRDTWLSTDDNYTRFRRFWMEGRVAGMTADLTDSNYRGRLNRWLSKNRKERISLVYVSNVEEWVGPDRARKMYELIGQLPLRDDACVLLSHGPSLEAIAMDHNFVAWIHNYVSSSDPFVLEYLISLTGIQEYPPEITGDAKNPDFYHKFLNSLQKFLANSDRFRDSNIKIGDKWNRSETLSTKKAKDEFAFYNRLIWTMAIFKKDIGNMDPGEFTKWVDDWADKEKLNFNNTDYFRALVASLVDKGLIKRPSLKAAASSLIPSGSPLMPGSIFGAGWFASLVASPLVEEALRAISFNSGGWTAFFVISLVLIAAHFNPWNIKQYKDMYKEAHDNKEPSLSDIIQGVISIPIATMLGLGIFTWLRPDVRSFYLFTAFFILHVIANVYTLVMNTLFPKYALMPASLAPVEEKAKTTPAETFHMMDEFIKKVILPVSGYMGGLPVGIEVIKTVENSMPILTLRHMEPHPISGQPVNFEYRIEFTGDEITTPEIPSLTAPNIIRIPTLGVDPENLLEAQDAWRRVTIADPLLYNRYISKVIENTPFQEEAIAVAGKRLHEKGTALIVMATGAGKTRVGLECARDYMENVKGEARTSGYSPGVILFIVNNNRILQEAEEKVYEYYGETYKGKVGRIYEGEESYGENTEIIFATPASLTMSNSQRLERLLKERGVEFAIFDEVHHIPAAMNRQIHIRLLEEAEKRGRPIASLGFTATEMRPDKLSVIEFFEHDIVYEYRIIEAWTEGYLVPIAYHAADEDILVSLHVDPDKVNAIMEGTPLYDHYHARLYDRSRFPELLAKYHHYTEGLHDKRTLILAPDIEKAEELCAFFRVPGNGRERAEAVTLTSKDKTENPTLFKDSYYAWKTGKWPEGSSYQDRPVPQVVVAVDMFREGIDAPAINTVMLWADTNSTIRYIQGIGRGLRPDTFKTHLNVIDAVGLYRKTHLLRYLVTVIQSKTTLAKNKKKAGEKKEREKQKEDIEAPDMLDLEGGGLILGKEVTSVIKGFFDDVLSDLEVLYGAYPLIPHSQRIRLDTHIAKRIGLVKSKTPSREDLVRGREELEKILTDIARGLISGFSRDDIALYRSLFKPAFFIPGIYEEEKGDIPDFGGTRILFERIQDLIYRSNTDLTEEQQNCIYEIFPEFSPTSLKRIASKNRAANFKTLREAVFGLSRTEMTRKFIEEILHNPKKEKEFFDKPENREAHHCLLLEEMGLNKGVLGTGGILYMAEGGKEKASLRSSRIDVGERHASAPLDLTQDWTARYYLFLLNNPEFDRRTFDMEPDNFFKFVLRCSLVRHVASPEAFFNSLGISVKVYLKLIGEGDIENALPAGMTMLNLLEEAKGSTYLTQLNLGANKIDTILGWSDELGMTIARSPEPRIREQGAKLTQAYDLFLEHLGLRVRVVIAGIPGAALIIKRAKAEEDYLLNIETTEAWGKGAITGIALRVSPLYDYLGNPTICIFLPPNRASTVEAFYGALDEAHRSVFLSFFVNTLVDLARKGGMREEDFVFVIPEGSAFMRDLFRHLLDMTEFDVFGLARNIGFAEVSSFSYNKTKESRLSFMTPEAVQRLRPMFRPDGKRVAKMDRQTVISNSLAYAYLCWHDFQNHLMTKWEAVQNKLDEYKPSDVLKVNPVRFLMQHINGIITSGETTYEELSEIDIQLDLLGADEPSRPVTDEQVVVICMDECFRESHGAARFREWWSRRGHIRSFFNLYTRFYRDLKRHGLSMPEAWRDEVSRFFLEIYVFFHENNKDFSESHVNKASKLKRFLETVSHSVDFNRLSIQEAGRAIKQAYGKYPSLNAPILTGFFYTPGPLNGQNKGTPTDDGGFLLIYDGWHYHWNPQCPEIGGRSRKTTNRKAIEERKIYRIAPCPVCGTPPESEWEQIAAEAHGRAYVEKLAEPEKQAQAASTGTLPDVDPKILANLVPHDNGGFELIYNLKNDPAVLHFDPRCEDLRRSFSTDLDFVSSKSVDNIEGHVLCAKCTPSRKEWANLERQVESNATRAEDSIEGAAHRKDEGGIIGAAASGDEKRVERRLRALQRRLDKEGGINRILDEDVDAQSALEDEALIRNALNILGITEEEIGSALRRIRLVDVRNREALDRPGRPRIGGVIVGTLAGPKVVLERFRLQGLSRQNIDESSLVVLGDLLHETIEYELIQEGMNMKEAHWQADEIKAAWVKAWRDEPHADRKIDTANRSAHEKMEAFRKELSDPYRLGKLESQFEDIIITFLVRRHHEEQPNVFDISALGDSDLAALRESILEEMRSRGWYATGLFKNCLNKFITKSRLETFKTDIGKNSLDAKDVALILERLHTLALNPSKLNIAEERIMSYSNLYNLVAYVAPTYAQSYRILKTAGLAGQSWDNAEADIEVLGYLKAWQEACRRGDEKEIETNIDRVFRKLQGEGIEGVDHEAGPKIQRVTPVVKTICKFFNVDIGRMEENYIMHIMNDYNRKREEERPVFIERLTSQGLRGVAKDVMRDFMEDGITKILNASNRLYSKGIVIDGFIHKGFDALVLSGTYVSGPNQGKKVVIKIRLLASRWIEPEFMRSNSEFIEMTGKIQDRTEKNLHFARILEIFEVTLRKKEKSVVEVCDYLEGETLDKRLDFWGLGLKETLRIVIQHILIAEFLLRSRDGTRYVDSELDNMRNYVLRGDERLLALVDYGHVWPLDELLERLRRDQRPDITRGELLKIHKNKLIKTAVTILVDRTWDTLDEQAIKRSKRLFVNKFGPAYSEEIFDILLTAYNTDNWKMPAFFLNMAKELGDVHKNIGAESLPNGGIIGAASEGASNPVRLIEEIIPTIAEEMRRGAPTYVIEPCSAPGKSGRIRTAVETEAHFRRIEKLLKDSGYPVSAETFAAGDSWVSELKKSLAKMLPGFLGDLEKDSKTRMAVRLPFRGEGPEERKAILEDIKAFIVEKGIKKDVLERSIKFVSIDTTGVDYLNVPLNMLTDITMMECDRYIEGDYAEDIPASLEINLRQLLRLSATNYKALVEEAKGESARELLKMIFYGYPLKAVNIEHLREEMDRYEQIWQSV